MAIRMGFGETAEILLEGMKMQGSGVSQTLKGRNQAQALIAGGMHTSVPHQLGGELGCLGVAPHRLLDATRFR
jgi:hypothetical protein